MGKQLYESIDQEDYVKAKQLIRDGTPVNYVDLSSGETPLMRAAIYGDDVELICMLVEHHANVRAATSCGSTALHILSWANNRAENFSAIVDILLQAGAIIDAKNASGETPLHKAARRRFVNKVQYLLFEGASPAIKNNKGARPVDVVENIELRRILLGRMPQFKKS